MSNNIYNTENIEAYLENKLSPSERVNFENEIKKDPLFENEVTLQKDIIESLKSHRKAQLKNRLSNIEVSLSPSYFEIGTKIAASVLVSGLISFGIYSYFNNSSEVVSPKSKTETTNTEGNTNTITTPSTTTQKEATKEEIQQKNTDNSISQNTAKTTTVKPSEKFNNRVAPSIDEDFDNNSFQTEENINIPKGQIAQTTDNKSAINVTIDGSTDKKFHYKYFSNKLFLYGNFDSTTYEILELNTYNNKQVYLYYNKNYYQLNANQLEISPLIQITDNKTLNDLSKLNK